jgi:predicted TIM-barrel fold metal-dependent hydrolase
MPRKPTINCHCHLLNFKCIPDKMTKLLAHIPEAIADDDWFSVAAGMLFALLPGSKHDRIRRFLKIFNSPFPVLTRQYITEMEGAGIDCCTPLMMDLSQASPGAADDNHPYEKQIELVSAAALAHPWKIFPFVMFDPRREDAAAICIDALETKGFVGVKMYPALGYWPSKRFYQSVDIEFRNLHRLYSYCGDRKVPITTHASTGGAYSTEMDRDREKNAWPLTEVSNWIDPIREYNLKINFAHFGGNYLNATDSKRVQSASWRRQICNLIMRSREEADFGDIYADLSFHDMALHRRLKTAYFRDLAILLEDDRYRRGVLFGTDASMISHTYLEREFVRPFRTNLSPPQRDRIFSDNPTRFLFRHARIPETYIAFLRTRIDSDVVFAQCPDWVVRDRGHYGVFTQ